MRDLVDALNVYGSGAPVRKRIVKYGNYLAKAKEDAPEKMTCVLCKSGMYKIAAKNAIRYSVCGAKKESKTEQNLHLLLSVTSAVVLQRISADYTESIIRSETEMRNSAPIT